MQVRKQQLEPAMKQQTGSKEEKEYGSSPKEMQLVSTKRPNVFSKDDVIWHQVFLKE